MDKVIEYIGSLSLPRLEREKTLPVIAAATLLLYTSYKFINGSTSKNNKTNNRQGLKEIPVPGSAYPYVGHMFSLGELPAKKISEWHDELGPIIKLRMGVKTWILVDNPALAHNIFVSHGAETSYRPHSTYAYYHYSMEGKGIAFSQPGAGWKEIRSAVISVLAPKQIEKYMDSINQEAQSLVSRLINTTKQKSATDPLKILELYSLNIIFSACFGRRFDSVEDPEFIKIADMIEKSMKYADLENDIANFLPAFAFIDYFAGTQVKMKRFVKTERDPICKQLIEEATKCDGPNFIKSLEENGFDISEDEKVVLVFDLIGGGTDTISVTLSWNIAIMCNYPHVQKTAAAEIDEFIRVNGRLPYFSERTQFPYCVSVIKECMRYKPTTAFGIPHAVYDDVEVDGYIIPKGSTLISNMDNMHRKSNIYPEPERFHPGRFMKNLKTMQAAANGKLEERDHFNFGWGRRICPAVYLAEVEIFSAYVQLMATCFIEPSSEGMPDINRAQNIGVNLLPYPYKVKFSKRADSLI